VLGDLLSETTGKRIVRRVVSTEPMKVEVSFEDSGQILGVNATGFGTYSSVVRPDGSIYGEGQGATMTQDGEMFAWKGSGLGKFKENGAVSYRGILYYQTTSQKLARLNTVAGVFEFEVDEKGSTHSKAWEWK
jgi:hypothetical protein